MGKKSKRKQQRRDQAPVKQQPVATQVVSTPQASKLTPIAPTATGKAAPSLSDASDQIRSDIRRIAMLLGVVVVILIALTIVDHKATILQKAGKHFSSFVQL